MISGSALLSKPIATENLASLPMSLFAGRDGLGYDGRLRHINQHEILTTLCRVSLKGWLGQAFKKRDREVFTHRTMPGQRALCGG